MMCVSQTDIAARARCQLTECGRNFRSYLVLPLLPPTEQIVGKFNNSFFVAKRSAATAHVIGSLENIFSMLPSPCAASARWLVNAAGPKGMERFFVFTAWLGAVVESAVWMLMYLDMPQAQVWTMYAMHGICTSSHDTGDNTCVCVARVV